MTTRKKREKIEDHLEGDEETPGRGARVEVVVLHDAINNKRRFESHDGSTQMEFDTLGLPYWNSSRVDPIPMPQMIRTIMK